VTDYAKIDAMNFLDALPEWDGEKRLPSMLSDIWGDVYRELGIDIMVTAVTRLLRPWLGDGTFEIRGPQGCGKTRSIKALLGDMYGPLMERAPLFKESNTPGTWWDISKYLGCVHCGTIDLDAIAEQRDQIWAEALHRYRERIAWDEEDYDDDLLDLERELEAEDKLLWLDRRISKLETEIHEMRHVAGPVYPDDEALRLRLDVSDGIRTYRHMYRISRKQFIPDDIRFLMMEASRDMAGDIFDLMEKEGAL